MSMPALETLSRGRKHSPEEASPNLRLQRLKTRRFQVTANTMTMILGILAIIAGILVLVFPVVLNIIVAIALFIVGAIILYQSYQRTLTA